VQPINTTISTRNNSTIMPEINNALTQIRHLKPGDRLVYTTIAKNNGVDRSTPLFFQDLRGS
jgi:hypothetical protein